MTEKVTCSAPGKVILFGEHSVVYGKMAIAASIGLRITAECLRSARLISLDLPDLSLNFTADPARLEQLVRGFPLGTIRNPAKVSPQLRQNLESVSQAPESAQSLAQLIFLFLYGAICSLGGAWPSLTLRVTSELPIGAGLGSSAAFSSSVAASLLIMTNAASREDPHFLEIVNSWAFVCECLAHGTPSGVDNTVSVNGGFVSYKEGSVERLPGTNRLRILVVNTKIPRSTKLLVAGVRSLWEKHGGVCGHVLDAMDEISREAWTCLRKGECALGELVRMSHACLSLLGVSCAELDSVVAEARRWGMPAKLTGAGGGGCALVMVPPGLGEEAISGFRASVALDCYDVSLGGSGLQVDSVESATYY